MANPNDGEIDAGSPPASEVPAQSVTPDGSPDLVAWVRTTLESPDGHPKQMPSSAGDDAAQIATPLGGGERQAENRSEQSDTSFIYVDYSAPATLSYSETVQIYRNLREAITAWLALPNEIKSDASITTNENGELRYRGWEIYRLWGRWDS